MSTAAQPITTQFDPDEFMKKRGSPVEFDPDEFMKSKDRLPGTLSPQVLTAAKTRSAEPTSIEKAQINKGYITPEQETENKKNWGWYGPTVSALQKHGFGASNLASRGWQGIKNIAGATGGLIHDIGNQPWSVLAEKYITEPAEQEKYKSEEAYKAGRISEGIGHGIAAGIPMIGPWMAGRSEQAGTGDIGGAIAETAGELLGGKMLAKTAGAATRIPKITRATAELGKKAIRKVGEPFHLGMTSEELLTKSISPRAKAMGWNEAVARPGVQRAIQEYDAASPIKSVKDFHEAIPEMQDKIWSEQVEPVLERQGKRTVDMKPVADAVRERITPEMKEFDEGGAADLDTLATKMEAARDVNSANRLLKYVNGKLEAYFAKYPSARKSNLLNNPETAGWEGARQALREQFLSTLEDAGETGIRDARQDYGALKTIEKQAEPRVNVTGRQKPFNLARMLGWGTMPVTGPIGPIVGEVITHLNKPDVLLRRGISRLNPPAAPDLVKPPAYVPPAAPATIPAITGEQLPLNVPPPEAPLFNIQQTAAPKVAPPETIPAISGEQIPLDLPQSDLPLFNLQQTEGRIPPLQNLGGWMKLGDVQGLEQAKGLTPRGEIPKIVYRVQDVGSTELNPESHAHATESLEEAQRYKEGRQSIEGKPQEIKEIDLSRMPPEDYQIFEGPNGHKWYRFKYHPESRK